MQAICIPPPVVRAPFFGERDDLIVGIVESMREREEKHM